MYDIVKATGGLISKTSRAYAYSNYQSLREYAMKRLLKTAFNLILSMAVLGICLYLIYIPQEEKNEGPLSMRGVWVSTIYNLDYPSSPGLSKDQLTSEADSIIENVSQMGLNAVFFQARPCADSLFPSEVFPWSSCLSGSQGVAPDGDFDALAYFTDKCHEFGLELHCWINPYRITRKAATSKSAALELLSQDHPVRQNPEYAVFHTDGCLYFDPGNEEARHLILKGIEEIIDNYDIDGIHFDDYFYPSSDFDDSYSFELYGSGYSSIGDFRRASVTSFIAEVNDLVESSEKDISFGVSPFGIWANLSDHPEGSDTKGSQSYYSHYADSLTWVREGLVDYIAPQLYWAIGNAEGEFETLLKWWSDAVSETGVSLYVGQAIYRLTDAEEGSVWYGTDEIERQLDMMAAAETPGVILFRYGSIKSNPGLEEFLTDYFSSF